MLSKASPLFRFLRYAINSHIAVLIHLFTQSKKTQWLVGGVRGELYSDNSKAFYEYLRSKHSDISVKWVARPGSPAANSIYEATVAKGSVDNYLQFFNSEVVIFSDTLNQDIAPGIYAMPLLRYFYNRIFKVRLNHGTISFKKKIQARGIIGAVKRNILSSYNLYIAATPLEVEVMQEYAALGTVVLAGSARNDTLKNKNSKEPMPVILISPTWRTWLNAEKEFLESDFYNNYSKLLGSSILQAILRDKGIRLEFYLHQMMHDQRRRFKHLENDVVKVLEPNFDISGNIVTSALMITDYSSICSERFLLNKPVIFFQFDQDKYVSETGSYINLKNDVFGSVSYTTDELVSKILRVIESDFSVDAEQLKGEKFFVHFKDNKNCERIYNAIISRQLLRGSRST